jgi:hypothetical protein
MQQLGLHRCVVLNCRKLYYNSVYMVFIGKLRHDKESEANQMCMVENLLQA